MLKIGQNWVKIANYPPNAQQRSTPLIVTVEEKNSNVKETVCRLLDEIQAQKKIEKMTAQLNFLSQKV